MNKKDLKRAARAIQSECGVKYTTAYQWVRENNDAIIALIQTDSGMNWKELGPAACGLWRRLHVLDT